MNQPAPYSRAFLDAFNRALGLHRAGQHSEAEAAYRQALQIQSNVALLHANLGSAIYEQGRLDEALIFHRRAIQLDPKMALAHCNLGATLIAAEQYDEAFAALRTAMKLEPNNPAPYNNLGGALARLGRLDDGVAEMQKALKLEPQSAQTLYNIGIAYFRFQKFEAAIEYLERAAALKPGNITFLAPLVIAQRETGRRFDQTLLQLLQTQPESQNDLQIKVWGALIANHPKIAFSIKPAGLCILEYENLAKLYRARDLAARLAALPEVTGTWPKPNGRPLITASADGKYAEMFAAELIASVLDVCPGCDFHLHLMNPGRFELKDYPTDRVTCTTEIIPDGERTIYSTRRFLRLPHLLARAGRPVISVDMDSIFNRDLMSALPAQFDVMIYERRDQPWPQQMVNAGFLAIAPNGRDFADFLAAYILHFEELGDAKWFVDQVGIVAARAWFQINVPELSILAAPPHMMDWSAQHDAGSIIWHYKGALKEASEQSR